MFTPPEGESPIMQMYLWRSPFRTVSSGSDAAVLYHEYTHGLSNRLVVDADGIGALNTAQAGAMGEGWSDWYAQDFLVGQFPALDTGEAGEVDMGAYVNASLAAALLAAGLPGRREPGRLPGARRRPGSGGYTYGDFGRILGSAEVHYDGEIWAQVLWDLRAAVGVAKARALVTAGMRLLPPEPSFLDARNGILLADQALYARRRRGARCGACSRRAGWASSRRRWAARTRRRPRTSRSRPAPEAPRGHDLRPRHGRAGRRAGRGRDDRARRRERASPRRPAPTAASRSSGVPAGTYLKVVRGRRGLGRRVVVAGGRRAAGRSRSTRCCAATGRPRAAARS